MSANNHQLSSARIGYGAIVAVFWTIAWALAVYNNFLWLFGKIPYMGPWDRSVHTEEYPDFSFFLLGVAVSTFMLALSLGALATCLIALRKVRRGEKTAFAGRVALDAIVLTFVFVLSMLLCGG